MVANEEVFQQIKYPYEELRRDAKDVFGLEDKDAMDKANNNEIIVPRRIQYRWVSW